MPAIGPYDTDLQMFVEEPRDARPAHLLFLRWLVERWDPEHLASDPPGGAFAVRLFRPATNRDGVPRWFGR